MRVLVTGANGFVGGHLREALRAGGHEPLCFDQVLTAHEDEQHVFVGDLREPESVRRVVAETEPDACIHLGGIAFVPMGWSNPQLVLSVNAIGTVNVLEAFRQERPNARLLVVTSSEIYGREARDHAVTETDPPRPANPYAVSKLAADEIALLYARRHGMPVMTARPHNHIGPGQSENFVVSSFAAQLARIKIGAAAPVMRVGNLDNARDFTDVRDVVEAYRILIEKGTCGQAYNIASGVSVKIGDILDQLCAIADIHPEVTHDPDRFRPTDARPALDISRIREDTDWRPNIPLARTLRDIYETILGELSGHAGKD